jgi:23S rRNA G2445 N2-methylase RlmL
MHRLLITTAPGLQGLLEDELREIGLEPKSEASGITALDGNWASAARILTRSRIASRILLSVRRFAAAQQAMLYDQVRRIDWPELFSEKHTLAVFAHGSTKDLDYVLPFAALRIKDGICDEFRKRGRPRPSVNRSAPDVRIEAFFFNGRCELSLDLTGEPLHRRGYRPETAEAPLRENRAAALLRFAGYDASTPLVDPFCGTGTIPIEAAMMASRRAPGLLRPSESYVLPRLFPDARPALAHERELARGATLEKPQAAVVGLDLSEEALEAARANARRAGVGSWITFRRQDARALSQPGAFIVTNPPYGERLLDATSAAALLSEFTSRAKHHCTGSRLALVLPRGPLEKALGLKPSRKLDVESGSMSTQFILLDLYAGSRKRGRMPS